MSRAALLIALLAGGCATATPAPISYGSGGGDVTATAPPPTIAPRGRAPITYTHDDGQPQTTPPTAPVAEDVAPPPQPASEPPNWADGSGVPLSTYALQPDDVQPYDPAHVPRSYRIGANESLYDVATRFQIPLRALIDQNHLEPPYSLAPGRVLDLPPPNAHVVQRGEDFEGIARAYNVDLRSLALLNRMQPPYTVRPGDRVYLPAMARADLEAPAPRPVATLPPNVAASAPPPIQGHGRFTWPLRGNVVARFGAQEGGGRLDGLEISGREGAPVVAAADGEVVYAGADLPAYGTLVLVRHADDLVTAYAYTRRALVREGQQVRAGQAIAELGPRAGGSRLLFQVRRGSSAVDPAPLLGN